MRPAAACLALLVQAALCDPALPPDPRATLLGPHAQQDLRSWLHDLDIVFPAGMKLSMGFGDMVVSTGKCWATSVSSLRYTDLSEPLLLKYQVRLSGVTTKCEIFADKLNVSAQLKGAQMNATVQIAPFVPEAMPNVPLPFGNVSLTSCNFSMAGSSFTVSGSPLDDGDLNLIESLVCTRFQEMAATQGSAAMETAASRSLRYLDPPKALPEPTLLQPSIDWAEYPPVRVVQNLVQERFSLWANRLVEILNVNSFDTKLVKTGNLSLQLRQLRLVGEGASDKPGMAIIGENQTLGVDADLPGLAVHGVLLFSVFLPNQPILNEVLTVKIGLNRTTMKVRALLDEKRFEHVVPDQVATSMRCLVDCSDGIVEPMNQSLAITDLDVVLRRVLTVNGFGELEQDVAALINSILSSLFNQGYMNAAQLLTSGGLGLAREPLNRLIWGKIEAMPPCSDPGMLLGLNEAAVNSLPIVAVVVLFLGLIAGAVAHRRRAPSARESPVATAVDGEGAPGEVPTAAGAAAAAVDDDDDGERRRLPAADEEGGGVCLARERVVPVWLAVCYPFAVVAVMLLYFFADFALGAVVSLVMAADGNETVIGPVFSFSLASTVVDSMKSGSWVISILTLVLSGIWPHVKLLLLLCAWVAPPRRFSTSSRRCVLSFLDTWGKYGFLESWFLVFSMSAFAIEWESVGSNASIKVRTTPVVAFYAYFVATCLTLILGHVASELHAAATDPANTCGSCDACGREAIASPAPAKRPAAGACSARENDGDVGAEESEQTADTSMTSGSSCSSEESEEEEQRCLSSKVDSRTRITVACGLAASVVLAIFSAFMTSFEFQISGIFIEFLLARPVEKDYSLLTVGEAVAEGRYDDAGLVTLEVFFFLLSFVVPLVLLIALTCLWFVPLTQRGQRKLARACRLLDAWACLDVAVLVLVIAILQFEMMAEFLVGKGSLRAPCQMIKNLAKEECLDITMHPHPGIAVLVLAGLALLIVPKVAMKHCEDALDGKASSTKASECRCDGCDGLAVTATPEVGLRS